MTILGTAAALSNGLQAGTSALSLVALAKTLISAPGISMSIDNPLSDGGRVFPPGGTVPYGKRGNFDVITSDRVTRRAQVTDHFTEDNYTIQDHIAFDPARVTITGEVGELVFSKSATERYIETTLLRLTTLGVLSPTLTVSALEYLAEYNRLASAVTNAVSAVEDVASMLGVGDWGLNKQQDAYKFFDGIFSNRIIVNVDTPWQSFKSMVIESFDFEQGEETADKTTVTVNFKEFRTVSALAGTGALKDRIFDQASSTVEKGVSKGKAVGPSVLINAIDGVAGAF